MALLAHQRCFHHSLREAVARCPQCRRFYCRECITEHDDRVICASCLRKVGAAPTQTPSLPVWAGALLPCAVGLATAWLFFYFAGELLLSIPADFHEGNVWVDRWFNVQ